MINRWSRAFKQKKGLRTRHRPRRFDARAALSRCNLSQQSVDEVGLTSAPVAHVLSHAHSNMFARVLRAVTFPFRRVT